MSDTTKTLGDSMAELADNIEAYNKWRRGSDLPHPDPEAIGVWLSAAVDVLRAQAAQAQAEPVAWTATRLWNSRETWTCPADIAVMLPATQPAQADELRIARGAIRELEAKVFSQEQALAVLRASVDSYHRDTADPPGYLQDAVIKAAGLGAMAEQLKAAHAELAQQAEKLTEVERIADDYGEQLNRQALMLSEAQAERQPLTDEQIRGIVREAGRGSALRRDGNTSLRIARAIERAHGIGAKGGAA